ncbi:hypothetical protein PL79_029085 [Burkholderia sp. USMB20]|nr:hypothetical protein PL79_029085 [Burkholderia sp. USMB20]
MRGDPRCGCPDAVHANTRASSGRRGGRTGHNGRIAAGWRARQVARGTRRKVRRIVNRARKRKPTALHGAGSGGF